MKSFQRHAEAVPREGSEEAPEDHAQKQAGVKKSAKHARNAHARLLKSPTAPCPRSSGAGEVRKSAGFSSQPHRPVTSHVTPVQPATRTPGSATPPAATAMEKARRHVPKMLKRNTTVKAGGDGKSGSGSSRAAVMALRVVA